MDKEKLHEEALEVYEECKESNWDGYEGCSVSEESLKTANKVIVALPDDCPEPELDPDPSSGEIAFGWSIEGRTFFFILTVEKKENGEREIDYAGIFDKDHVHGGSLFDGENIPDIIRLILGYIKTEYEGEEK